MARDYNSWGWNTKSDAWERVYYDVQYSYTTDDGRAMFYVVIWNDSYTSYGDTGNITWKISDKWNSNRASGSRGNIHTTGYNQIVNIWEGPIGVYYDGDGTMGGNLYIDFTFTATRALPTWGRSPVGETLRATVPHNGDPIAKLAYYDKEWTPDGGLTVHGQASGINGHTYRIEVHKRDGSGKFIEKQITLNKDYKVTFTEDEKAKIYNELTYAAGNKLRILLATWKSGEYQGGDSKYDSNCKPNPVEYTNSATVNIGSGIGISVTRAAKGLQLEYGIAFKESWLAGYPQKTNYTGTTMNLACQTNTWVTSKALRATAPTATSFPIQIYVRQRNAGGHDLGAVIKTATVKEVAPTLKAVHRDTAPTRFRNYIHLNPHTGGIVEIERELVGFQPRADISTSLGTDRSGSQFYTQAEVGLNPQTTYPTMLYIRYDGSNLYHKVNIGNAVTRKLTTLVVSPNKQDYKNGEMLTFTTTMDGTKVDFQITPKGGKANNQSGTNTVMAFKYQTVLDEGVAQNTFDVVITSWYAGWGDIVAAEQIRITILVKNDGDCYVYQGGEWVRAEIFVKNASGQQVPATIKVLVSGKWVTAVAS